MKRIHLLVLFALVMPFMGMAAHTYRLGTYNLRIQTSKDTGEKDWDNRKGYIARTVIDNKYDVIGFQEIAGSRQKQDLEALLPNYELVAWGRNSASDSEGEGVGVAFLKDRYTLLEQGHFFLTETPGEPGIAWDAAYKRVSVYVKLKDKRTGDVFCFCSTHFDNEGKTARMKGAGLNVSKILEVAGDTPAFIVGDLNAEPHETAVHEVFAEQFEDSRIVSKKKPEGYEGTYCNWLHQPTTQRIDYVYCRKAEVLSYKTIVKDYGRALMPSDHIPVQIKVRLSK
ncbi:MULTISPECIES: endonuclease/exonuclease/phosphatase family protein [Bacteroides]|jgi:endonuclease/exonuclease/phosphatase family metal-dependent hydrolase|uniref:endonuclease/exonuclease/phosphatase family protein n=1 Tax=Bacteroides TaxID=816 RepID=UPI00189D2E4F|nr:endonuclease/exonuclease/phosphatase family protein [Bacteroides nordii]